MEVEGQGSLLVWEEEEEACRGYCLGEKGGPVASNETEWQGCWATKGHVVGEVMVVEEAEVMTAEKKKKTIMTDKILGVRLVFY